MSKFLDSNGLLYLWSKITAGFVAKETGKGLSSNDYTAAEKTKLGGIAASANNYSHPTAAGSKHIPAGGASGQFLKWSADGTAVWAADNNTTYSAATTSANGLMSAADKTKLDGVAEGANNYTHPAYTAKTAGLYKVTVDAAGHVSAAAAVAKSDITALGIPASNTTYSAASGSAAGLMSAADKTKLDGFGAASSYALKSELTSMYRYKGSKSAYSGLPTTGNTVGDVWNVEADGMNYAWDGTAWDALGASFTVPTITNAEIDTIVAG